jgi:hypothetical protein
MYMPNPDGPTERKPPGPKADRLKIDRPDWEEAMRDALKVRKPADGWPQPPKREEKAPKQDHDG